jgi:hypothetical protein
MLKLTQHFEGFRTPSADFDAVKNHFQTLPHHVDIDLGVAHLGSAALFLDLVGTDILIDAESTGVATLEFQNESFQSDAPVKVTPGFTASFDFTRIKLTNHIQTGKFLRIIYGVDTKFTSGQVSIVAPAPVEFAGQPVDPLNVITDGGNFFKTGYLRSGALAALTPLQIIDPLFNTEKGMVVHRMDCMAQHLSVLTDVVMFAAYAPPAVNTPIDENLGAILLAGMSGAALATSGRFFTDTPFRLDKGMGLYLMATTALSASVVCAPSRILR